MHKGRMRWLAFLLVCVLGLSPITTHAEKMLLLSTQEIEISLGDSEQIKANQRVQFASGDQLIARVLPDGTIEALNEGTTTIIARSATGQVKTARVIVKATPKPSRVELISSAQHISLHETHQLTASVHPLAASQKVQWSTSNKKIATVSQAGLVTPRREGKVRISVRSKVRKSVRASIVLTITDPLKPTDLAVDKAQTYLKIGETTAIRASVLPETADRSIKWTSNHPDIASVDDAGNVRAMSAGHAIITAETVRGKLKAETRVAVLSGERTGVVPARTTARTAASLKQNVGKIDSVYLSALDELEYLAYSGKITQGDFAKRQRILQNAFAMYRFPWYTGTRVAYWSSAYNGKKDFRQSILYYGLPYIQTGKDQKYTNRRYNVAKALSQGYWRKGSGGAYSLTSKRQGGRYVGNDCSSYVCMATFAGNGYTLSSAACYMVTSEIAKSSRFKTISYDALRPGDVLVLSGSHVVMFLYYMDTDQKRMMIIEQGGGNTTTDIHNTVTCSVVNRSSYSGKYVARRAEFLNK